MDTQWEIVESGPSDAEHTVLLLPGALCHARSYAEVMAEPALAHLRLVAATFPGQAGAPPPADYAIEAYARITADLVRSTGAEVVVGFSMGAVVTHQMLVSGAFSGPAVLLALSLSSPDEPAFLRVMVRLGSVLGTLPAAVMKMGVASMVGRAPLPPERREELAADFALNRPRDMRLSLGEYVKWLRRDDDRARRLCEAGVPLWILHAEKGDGGLTPHERSVLEACPTAHVEVLPGNVFFLPNEVPDVVAKMVVEAVGQV